MIKYLTPLICSVVMISAFHPSRKKILFFGDSITEAGVGPQGFITRINTRLLNKNISDKYELLGAGIGGNKVYDLYLRLENDVLAKNPDVVVIWVGVNDVWHKQMFGTGTDPDKFERFYDAIIKKLKDRKAQVYICTPAVIGEKIDCTNELDGDLNKYAGIIRNIARKNNCALIDLRKTFQEYLKQHNPNNLEKGVLTSDRVHLNDAGNQLVADEMIRNLGL